MASYCVFDADEASPAVMASVVVVAAAVRHRRRRRRRRLQSKTVL